MRRLLLAVTSVGVATLAYRLTKGVAASRAAPSIMQLALALQASALRARRGSPFPLTDEQERSLETLTRQVFNEIDRLESGKIWRICDQ